MRDSKVCDMLQLVALLGVQCLTPEATGSRGLLLRDYTH